MQFELSLDSLKDACLAAHATSSDSVKAIDQSFADGTISARLYHHRKRIHGLWTCSIDRFLADLKHRLDRRGAEQEDNVKGKRHSLVVALKKPRSWVGEE